MTSTVNKDVIRAIDRTMREVQTSIADLDREVERAKRRIEQESKEQRIGLMKQIKQLETARKAVVNGNHAPAKKKPARGKGPEVDPHKRAGPGAIKKVSEYFQRFGKAYQSAIVRDLPLQPSQVTYAVQALVKDGLIKPTGESYRGSKEYAWVGDRGRVKGVEPGVGEFEGRKREQVAS